MTEIIKLAKGMGLEGDNLKSFIKEKKTNSEKKELMKEKQEDVTRNTKKI